jgi:hypothetical protein
MEFSAGRPLLLRPWTLSSDYAGVVTCGHLVAAAGGSYLALSIFSELALIALGIIHVSCNFAWRFFLIIPIELRLLHRGCCTGLPCKKSGYAFSKCISEQLELRFYPSRFSFKIILESLCISVQHANYLL